MSGQPPQQQGSSQPNRPIQIQPAQAQQLVKQFEYEVNAAEQAGLNTPAGRQHSQRAEGIKNVLLEYKKQQQRAMLQRQQLQQQQQQQQQQSMTGAAPIARPQMQAQPKAPVQAQPAQQPQAQQPQAQGQVPQQTQARQFALAVQRFQQAKKYIEQIQAQLRTVETAKSNPNITDRERQDLQQKEVALKTTYDQARRMATQSSQQIQQLRAQIPNLEKTLSSQIKQQQQQQQQSPAGQSPNMAQAAGGTPAQMNAAMAQKRPIATPNQQNLTPQQQAQLNQMRLMQQQKAQQAAIRPQQQAAQQGQPFAQQAAQPVQTVQTPASQQQRAMSQTPQRAQTPGSAPPQSAQPAAQQTPAQAPGTPVTMVNAAARPSSTSGVRPAAGQLGSNITKPVVPINPIPDDLKVELPKPVTTKLNNRPSILGGNAVNAPALTTPTLVRPPAFEMEGDRVLHKRKLKELVRSVGADEGDGEVVIDGDVEELLLDLADEFVTSVTGFACRLAKHRKADTIDVKDIQLHLERNWNIRVPGHSSDEIRSIRKWNPTPAYNQKMAGLNLARSINKNS